MKRILIEESVVDPKACSYGFPWKRDSICYNFNMPQECITVADIDKLTDKTEIETLVIGCNLDGYDFISDMTGLRQLYIYKGDNVTNIVFLRNLTRLQQLYIVGSHIRDIDPICELALKKERLFNVETEPF